MRRKIAVAGGTGVLGRHVVEVAGKRGYDAVTLAHSTGVDLVTGTGLDGVLDDVEAVVDVTSIQTQSARASEKFYGAVTSNLLQAEKAAGVGHHVALSIVGADKAPYGYYAGKVLQERLVTESDVPWSLVRATQFHEFAGQIMERLRYGRFVIVPQMRSQPVAASEVAGRLIDLVDVGPSGRVADFGGPREENAVDMVRALRAATGTRVWILPVPFPGALGRALRDGTLVAGSDADHGTQTYADWLRSRA
ncbi:SDR family oxidoreductase [Promicromonospora sp. NPDC060271]|uniref:SDR family oxidoreductase n=1 Tax=Promicromonospora sp. NPDC060271 TaxID=3347089 RepID=UPI00364D419F